MIRHGNALAVVVPVEYCRYLQIKRGDYCGMALNEREQIVIEQITDYTAAKLLEDDRGKRGSS